jgi:hypothetical protein
VCALVFHSSSRAGSNSAEAPLLASKKAALEEAEARQRQKEAAARRRNEQLAEEEAPRPAKRFDPYLAHRQDAQAVQGSDVIRDNCMLPV